MDGVTAGGFDQNKSGFYEVRNKEKIGHAVLTDTAFIFTNSTF